MIGILVVIVLIAIIGSMGGNDKPKKVEPAANSQSVDTTAKETVTEDPAQPDEQEQEQEQEQEPVKVFGGTVEEQAAGALREGRAAVPAGARPRRSRSRAAAP